METLPSSETAVPQTASIIPTLEENKMAVWFLVTAGFDPDAQPEEFPGDLLEIAREQKREKAA
jgi:hypothetical protein